jgi:hypothetical protein
MKQQVPLEERESTLKGEDKAIFIRLMRKMLQWEPSQRSFRQRASRGRVDNKKPVDTLNT